MKKIIFILIISLAALECQAQLLRVGVRGGYGSSSLKYGDMTLSSQEQDVQINAVPGAGTYHVGAVVVINLPGPFQVIPEALFVGGGGRVEATDLRNNATVTLNQEFKRFEIPVNLNLKLGPARIMVGPSLAWMISSNESVKTHLESTYPGFEVFEDTNGLFFGYQAGIGVSLFKHLLIDLRYEEMFGKTFNFQPDQDRLEIGPQSRRVAIGAAWLF